MAPLASGTHAPAPRDGGVSEKHMWQAHDELKQLIEKIARYHLRIQTLETQYSDSFDFHEVSVWQLRDALIDAYNRGVSEGRKGK